MAPWRSSNQSIASYRSSSSASSTPSSSASVVVCHQRVVASLVCGASTRATIIAHTRSRSRQGDAASNAPTPKRCMATSTACTWPCAREAIASNSASGRCSGSPRSTARMARICSSLREDRFASVRLRTRAPSRNDSRSRYAGREPRFGTMSICMATLYGYHHAVSSHYMATSLEFGNRLTNGFPTLT